MASSSGPLFSHLFACPLVSEAAAADVRNRGGWAAGAPSAVPPPPPPPPAAVTASSGERANRDATTPPDPPQLQHQSQQRIMIPVEELAYRKERAMLRSVLSEAARRVRFRSEAATAHSFLRNATECTVLHFTGHGAQGSIAIEDEYGGMHLIPAGPLRAMLKDRDTVPRVVFMSACFSESVVGEAFEKAGVPHVVAVAETSMVLDQKALDFTHTFYTLLLGGCSVQQAFDAGRIRVGLSIENSEEANKFRLLPEGQLHDEKPFAHIDGGSFEDLTLPLPPSSCWPVSHYFVRRQEETFSVMRLLLRGTRAVTVVGPRGVGKTQVVLRACAYARERHAVQEIIFVPFPTASTTLPSSPRRQDAHHSYPSTLHLTSFAVALGCDPDVLLNSPDPIESLVVAVHQRVGKSILDGASSRPTLLVLDGCAPLFVSFGTLRVKLVDVLEQLLSRVPRLQLLVTMVTQVGLGGEKTVRVGPLDTLASADLFVKSAPRDILVSELKGGSVNLLDGPLNVFSRGSIVANMGGHPGVILAVSSRIIEGFSLLEHEYDLLSEVIPYERRRYTELDAAYMRELQDLDEGLRLDLEPSASDAGMGTSPEYELPAWEPLVPDHRDGSISSIGGSGAAGLPHLRMSSSKASIDAGSSAQWQKQTSDAWERAVEVMGRQVWRYVCASCRQQRTSNSGHPQQMDEGVVVRPLWSELCLYGLKPFFNLHVGGKGRPLSEADLEALGSTAVLWGGRSAAPAHNHNIVSERSFFRRFWPWFQAMVAMLKISRGLWQCTDPLIIFGFSADQILPALEGRPAGTFGLKISTSVPAALVFCYVHEDGGIKNVLAEMIPNGRFVVTVANKRAVNSLGGHILGVTSLACLVPDLPKKGVVQIMRARARADLGGGRPRSRTSSDKQKRTGEPNGDEEGPNPQAESTGDLTAGLAVDVNHDTATAAQQPAAQIDVPGTGGCCILA
jgi:hypothetical protein